MASTKYGVTFSFKMILDDSYGFASIAETIRPKNNCTIYHVKGRSILNNQHCQPTLMNFFWNHQNDHKSIELFSESNNSDIFIMI